MRIYVKSYAYYCQTAYLSFYNTHNKISYQLDRSEIVSQYLWYETQGAFL